MLVEGCWMMLHCDAADVTPLDQPKLLRYTPPVVIIVSSSVRSIEVIDVYLSDTIVF